MSILDLVLNNQNGAVVNQIANKFGLDANQVQAAISQILPKLAQGFQKSAGNSGSINELLKIVQGGNVDQYLDSPDAIQNHNTDGGNAILGQLLGSKEESRALASNVAEKTGVSADILKQLLPVAASLFMGAANKQTAASGGLSNLISGLTAQGQKAGGGLIGTLNNLLDADKDGSAVDDILGFFSKKAG